MKEKAMPTGTAARTGTAAITAAKFSVKKAGFYAKNAFASQAVREKDKLQHEEEIARLIFDALGALKGTALKAAQMISMETEIFPETLRKELAQSTHQAPPINRPLIRRILTSNLGTPPEKLFSDFNSAPFAAASLGQVHAATYNGRSLAVKVQYPGIRETIRSDLTILKNLTRMLPAGFFGESLFKEIQERLLEEADYRREAEYTQHFRHAFRQRREIIIPEVLEQFSGDVVLTTARITGLHLDDWLATAPSDKAKNAYAQLLADFLAYSMNVHHCIHADPNAGNFLFRDDGALGVLDFGCVRSMDPHFVIGFNHLLRAFLEAKPDIIIDAYEKLGMLDSTHISSADFDEYIRPWAHWWARVFNPDGFDYGAQKGFVFEGVRLRTKMTKYFTGIPREIILLDRTVHGYLRMFERLGAKVILPIGGPAAT